MKLSLKILLLFSLATSLAASGSEQRLPSNTKIPLYKEHKIAFASGFALSATAITLLSNLGYQWLNNKTKEAWLFQFFSWIFSMKTPKALPAPEPEPVAEKGFRLKNEFTDYQFFLPETFFKTAHPAQKEVVGNGKETFTGYVFSGHELYLYVSNTNGAVYAFVIEKYNLQGDTCYKGATDLTYNDGKLKICSQDQQNLTWKATETQRLDLE